MTQSTINQRLKILIKALHLTTSAFSAALNVSEATTRNYTSRGSIPSADYLEKIIRQFESVNPTWLLTGNGEVLLDQAVESRVTYQKVTGGNHVGYNATSGTINQSVGHIKPKGEASEDQANMVVLTKQEHEGLVAQIRLLTSQLADKERVIQVQDRLLSLLAHDRNASH